jgi:hypothetical protein
VRRLLLLLLCFTAACPEAAAWPGDFVGTAKSQLGEDGTAQQISRKGYLKVRSIEAKGAFTVRGQFAVPGLANIELATCDWKARSDGRALTLESATCNVIDTAQCRFRMSFSLGRVVHTERDINLAALGSLSVQCEGKSPTFQSGERALRVAFEGLRQ